ncbi:MAG: AAA family ATPase [Lactobacillaceae bacterium]|jgi:Holliday junction resolvasome RuvABC ATP-dependent DNA helicase subunit|nr:AAA family ATPase [Lactobacillaceae bacterium]
MKTNPFSPQFGIAPTIFIGREVVLAEIQQAAKNKLSPWRNVLISAPRGYGKTALLSDLRGKFKANFVSLTMSKAFVNNLKDLLTDTARVSELGFNSGFLNGKIQFKEKQSLLSILKEALNKRDLTVFMIDEIQGCFDVLAEFAIAYQQLVQDGYNVMLLMAGLPAPIEKIMSQPNTTFLYRSKRVRLAPLNEKAVATAVTKMFKDTQKEISVEQAETFAKNTQGYTYLVQLFGYNLWQATAKKVSDKLFYQVFDETIASLPGTTFSILLKDLSPSEYEILEAMSQFEIAEAQDLVEVTKKSKQTVYNYTEKLIGTGLVERVERGKTKINIPFLRDYLNEASLQSLEQDLFE